MLEIYKERAAELVRRCEDVDLLDLICKLIITEKEVSVCV